MLNKKLLLIITTVLFLSQNTMATNKIVNCEITGLKINDIMYKGKCDFLLEEKGSFSISNIQKEGPLFAKVLVVSVYMIGKNTAEVRGLTSAGNNSRWGEAKRSKKDKACWIGEDFRICVR